MASGSQNTTLRTNMTHPIHLRRIPTPMTPAWIVCAWPPLLWQAECAPELHFVHLGTRVLSRGDANQPCSGQTVWGNAGPEPAAGVAWDWIEIHEGVVAIADPFALVTNLQLLDERGERLPRMQAALH